MIKLSNPAGIALTLGLAGALVLSGCSASGDESLTDPAVDTTVTEETTSEAEDENLSPEIYPFAEGIPFTVLVDCNEQIEALLSDTLGAEPTAIGFGADSSAAITQQSGVGIDNVAAELFDLLTEYISPAACMVGGDAGPYGQTVEVERTTGLPDGMSGLEWITRYVDPVSENCDEYVERRAFWFLQEDNTIHLTSAEWTGCSVEGEFPNDVGWEEIYEQAFAAHDLLLARLQ